MSEKKVSIEVDVKIEQAKSQVESLSKSINTKLKDKKINLKVDTRQVMQSFTGITNQANKSANKMAQAFAKAFDSTGKSIKNINKNISNAMSKVTNVAKKGGTKAGKAFANAFNKAIKSSMRIFKSIGSMIIKGITSAIRAGSKLIFGVAKSIGSMIVKGITGAIKAGLRLIKNVFTTIGNIIVNTIKGAINTAKKIISTLGNAISGVFRKTYQLSIEASASVRAEQDSDKTSSLMNAGMMAASLKTITSAAIKGSMPPEVGHAASKLSSKLIDAGQRAISFGKFIYQAYVMIRSNWPKIIAIFGSLAQHIIPLLRSGFTQLVETVKTVVTKNLPTIIGKFREIGEKIYPVVKESFFNALKKVSNFIDSGIQKMLNSTDPRVRALGQVLDLLKKYISYACKKVSEFAANLPKVINGLVAFINWLKKIKDAFKSFIKGVREAGEFIINIFKIVGYSIQLAGIKIAEGFSWACNKIKSGADFLKDKFTSLGHRISEGFKRVVYVLDEVIPGFKKLRTSIATVCRNIVNKVKDAFKGLKQRIKDWFNGDSSSQDTSNDDDNERGKFGWADSDLKEFRDSIAVLANKIGESNISKSEIIKIYDRGYGSGLDGRKGIGSIDDVANQYDAGVLDQDAILEHLARSFTNGLAGYADFDEKGQKYLATRVEFLTRILERYLERRREGFSDNGGSSPNDINFNDKELQEAIKKLKEELNEDDETKIHINVDTSDLNEQIDQTGKKIKKAFGEGSFTENIKSIDDAIMAYASFENSLEAVLHPFRTLKKELTTKIAFRALGDIKQQAEKTTESFGKLREAVQKFKQAGEGKDKQAASLNVLAKSAQFALNKLKLVLKANTVGKLIEKMKGPAEKATKELADKVPGGKDNINLFKGAINKLGLLFGGIGLVGITKDATTQAIKYEAALGQLNRRLGESASVLDRFASSKGLDLGLSRSQIAEYGNIFSVYVSQFESDSQAVANTTQSLLEAAAKTAQATGYDMTTVMDSFRSALTGSSEAVDQYGLNMKIANLELTESFKQVANGVDSWDKLTTAQQQQIIAMEMVAQTNKNFGDGVKNTNTLMLRFQAVLSNVKLALGNTFKVILTAVLPPLTALLQTLEVVLNHVSQFVSSLLSLMGVEVSFDNAFGNIDTSNVSDAGDSVDAIGDSADKATENAKKLKGELAGFDEINKITMQQDESAESPSVGGMEITDMTIGEVDTKPAENKIQEFAQKVKDIFESIGGAFMEGWDVNLPYINESLENLKAAFGRLKESASNLFQSIWDNGGEQLITNIGRLSSAVVGLAIDLSGQIVNALAGVFDHLDPSNNPAMQYFLDSLNGMVLKAEECILAIGGHFASLMEHGGQEFINNLADIAVALGGLVAELTGEVFEAITKFMEHIDPANNPGTQKFLDSINVLAQKVEEFIMSIGDWFSKFMDYGKLFAVVKSRKNGENLKLFFFQLFIFVYITCEYLNEVIV